MAKFWNKLLLEPERSLLGRALRSSCRLALGPAGSKPIARQPWAGQVAVALQQVGITLDLGSPSPLSIQGVVTAWKDWYLDKTRQLDGTKIHFYVHQVRGGLPAEEYLPADYLAVVPRRQRRRPMSQLKMGAHWLMEEKGRWSKPKMPREQRLCPHCTRAGREDRVEDLEHLLFSCESFDAVRSNYVCLNFSDRNLHAFFQQPPLEVVSLSNVLWKRHQELEIQYNRLDSLAV